MIDSQIKILIVDDNRVNLIATEFMLRKSGYQLITAKDGKECLKIVNSERPDLILLDVNLPDISGIEICRIIKGDRQTNNIYVLMMSGFYTDPDNQAHGLEIGADGYIAKPFQKRELLARIQSLMRIKKAETELRYTLEEKKELEEIINRSPVVVFKCKYSKELQVIYVSENVKIFDYTPSDFISNELSFPNIILEEDRIQLFNKIKELILNHKVEFDEEFRVCKKNGEICWVNAKILIRYDDQLKPISVEGLLEDISKRKEWENLLNEYQGNLEELVAIRTEELEKTNKKLKREIKENKKAKESVQDQFLFLKTLIDALPNAISFKDRNFKFIHYNKAFDELFNVTKKQGNFITASELRNPGLYEQQKEIDKELLNIPSTIGIEIAVKDKNNKRRDLILSKTSFMNTNGEIAGILAVATDISERKNLEEQLRESLRKEKELNEFQAKFISTVSHEFRTPLTAILGAADLLEMFGNKWDQEKFREYVSRIQKASEYLTELINDLLTIRKSESGYMVSQPAKVHFYNLCHETAKIVSCRYETTHEIELNYNFEDKYIWQDEKLLKTILLNLLSNAVKFSPKGGKVLFEIYRDECKLAFSIKDDGIGMSSEDKEKLFEPFYRGTNSRKVLGTGLGLFIVKKSVELCGGTITLESQVDSGTTITVLIPYK